MHPIPVRIGGRGLAVQRIGVALGQRTTCQKFVSQLRCHLSLRGDPLPPLPLLCLEAWKIKITDALMMQIDYPGRYDPHDRENFVEKIMKLS